MASDIERRQRVGGPCGVVTGGTVARRGRIAGLDGLRALAVLAVLAFHLRVPGADLGWAGVELFFVLSGFLITRILLDYRDHSSYFRTFYARRAVRILPIYFLVIGASVAVALATDRAASLADLPFYLLYVQNYYPQIASGMGGGIPLTSHTWTLAVEEQFYWLWPLVVLWVTGRKLRLILIAIFLAAPFARLALLLLTGNPFATIASLPGQMDALAAGAFIATIDAAAPARQFARWGALACASGTVLLAALVAVTGPAAFGDPARWAIVPANVLVFSAMAILFAGLTAVVLAGENPVTRMLSVRPLTHIGVISYGLYLYSPLALFLVSAMVDPEHPTEAYLYGGGVGFAVAVVVVNYLSALASWRYLEKPALRLKRRFAPGESVTPMARVAPTE